jgi:hypothetical protein
MGAEHRPVGVRDAASNLEEELPDVFRRRVSDRVGQVDRGGSVGDRRFDHAAEEVPIAAGGVLRRKLHIVGELPRALHAVDDLLEARLAGDAQLLFDVQIGSGEKGMNPFSFGRLERPRRLLDVALAAPGERGNHRTPHLARHLPGCLRIGGRRNRETSLDDIDAECIERPRQVQLRRHVHRKSGSLLAVAQSRVEHDNRHNVGFHGTLGNLGHDDQL